MSISFSEKHVTTNKEQATRGVLCTSNNTLKKKEKKNSVTLELKLEKVYLCSVHTVYKTTCHVGIYRKT